MTDLFAEFGLPRRPYLDEDALKESFHALTIQRHPDVRNGEADAFAELNKAFNTLRNPVLRVRHLLELEAPELIACETPISEAVGNLFMRVGDARQRLHVLRRKEESAAGTLGKALLAPEKIELMDELQTLLEELRQRDAEEIAEIAKLDQEWRDHEADQLSALAGIYRRLAFYSRWAEQLREELLKLEM